MNASDVHLKLTREQWSKSRFFNQGYFAIPPVEEHMTYFDGGNIRLGLESRLFNTQIVNDNFESYGREPLTEEIDDDGGPSVHVFGSDDGHEYLRFDCFDEFPHYHYLVPGLDGVTTIPYDPIANGGMLPWVLTLLRNKLGELLLGAGAMGLANGLDRSRVRAILDELGRVA